VGSVTLFTAARMQQIEDTTVVSGLVDVNGDLILTTREGVNINAGLVRGANGVDGVDGVDGAPGADATALLGVSDSTTVDLSLTGAGTPASPWSLVANVLGLPSTALETGLLEPTYRGGLAKVKTSGGLSSESYPWLTPYNPQGSRKVNLLKVGTSKVITGQCEDETVILALNTTYWGTYNDYQADTTFSSSAKAVKLSSGLVVLSGLLRAIGTPPSGTLIATLPVGYRPDTDMIFNVEYGNVSQPVTVSASTGTITTRTAIAGAQYLSLDGIAFYSAGVATWTPIGSGGSAFSTNFENWTSTTNWGVASYWKDPYGFVWFRGLVRVKVATSVDNTNIFTLPATHRVHKEHHIRTTGNDLYAGVGAKTTDGLNWKANSPTTVGSWISLAGVVLYTTDALNNNPWVYPGLLANTWVNLGGSYTQASYLLREDGLCVLAGLLGTGTYGSKAFILKDREYWPSNGRIILATVGSQARGRLDISGSDEITSPAQKGNVTPSNGTSGWFSLDSKMWVR
jgi:hypothetical protein